MMSLWRFNDKVRVVIILLLLFLFIGQASAGQWSTNGSTTPAWQNSTYANFALDRNTGNLILPDNITSGLVLYHKESGRSGITSFDMNLTSNNNGTLTGMNTGLNNGSSGWNSSGKYGNAISFDGVNDHVNCSNGSALNMGTGNFTFMAWYNTTGTSTMRIGGKGGSASGGKRYVIEMGDAIAGQIAIEIDDNTVKKTVLSTGTYNDGKWHYVAGVRDGNNLRLYNDGKEDVNSPVDITGYGNIDSIRSCYIGTLYAEGTGLVSFWKGTIDEVRIYNRALSNDEINQTMNNTMVATTNITAWHDSGTGNETYHIDVNASGTNANYSAFYRTNGTGAWTAIGTPNSTVNQSILLTTKYQNTDVKIELYGNTTSTIELQEITFWTQASSSVSIIVIPANSWGMFNNWSYTTNFSSIAVNESNDVAYTFYNVTSGEWESYYPGYSWNSANTINKNNSIMGFFNAETTITANTVTPLDTSITEGWNMLYLMGTTNRTMTEICTNMVNCTDIYYYNSTINDYVSTGTDTIQPNQGFLAYVNQTGTWIRSTI